MDNKSLGGLIVIVVFVAIIAGVSIFNPYNHNTSPVNNAMITVNQTGNNSTNSNDILPSTTFLTFIPFSGVNSPSSSAVTPSPSPGPSPDPMDHIISLFDAYINSIYNQSLITGMAVVIVKNDKIIYMNCRGVRDLASGAPVDENTLFGIGSATKQFTATNVAQLVSAGKMSWDDLITKYYPDSNEFQLYNDNVTDNITIRDCFLHRSGLPTGSGDVGWSFFNNSYPSVLHQLRYIQNTTPFRTTYQYNNIIYALPGYCAAKSSNTPWSELIKKDLLDPLGMTTATTTLTDFLNSPNHAKPYWLLSNGTFIEHDIVLDSVGPAGSMACSISQMANWLRFQIADTGYYNGQKILNKTDLDETRTAQIDYLIYKYGFGWYITNGTLFHGGDTNAFHANVEIFPSQNVGIAIFTDGGVYGIGYRDSFFYKLNDLMNGNENTDPWPAAKNTSEKRMDNPLGPSPSNKTDPLPLATYLGVYSNDFYGNINITAFNNTLICYYGSNNQPSELTHWNENVFYDQSCGGVPFNFTDIQNSQSYQLQVTGLKNYNTTPTASYSVFNRTNST